MLAGNRWGYHGWVWKARGWGEVWLYYVLCAFCLFLDLLFCEYLHSPPNSACSHVVWTSERLDQLLLECVLFLLTFYTMPQLFLFEPGEYALLAAFTSVLYDDKTELQNRGREDRGFISTLSISSVFTLGVLRLISSLCPPSQPPTPSSVVSICDWESTASLITDFISNDW